MLQPDSEPIKREHGYFSIPIFKIEKFFLKMLSRLQQTRYKSFGDKMKVKLTEKQIEKDILIYLNSIPMTFAFKVNTGGFFDTKRNVFRKNLSPFLLPGTSDIICCHNGKFLAIEVKTPITHKQTMRNPTPTQKRQVEFLNHIVVCGGASVVASSINDVIAALAVIDIET